MATPVYVDIDDLKQTLELTGETFADPDLTRAIAAASRAIDEVTGRRFYPDTDADQVRKFLPINSGYCVVDDLCEFTQLDFQGDVWELDADFYFEPINAAADGRPWTSIRTISRPFIYTLADIYPGFVGFDGRITVTGMFGWAETPDQIVEAAGILANRLMRRAREAPFAVIGNGMDAEAIRLGKYDPDVSALVDPFTKVVIV